MQNVKQLWNRWKQPKTLVGICGSRLLLFLGYVLLIYQIFSFYTANIWKEAFPTIEDYISYSSSLYQDEFQRIPSARFQNCGVLIYGEHGRVIYASDQQMRYMVNSEEFAYIPDVSDNYAYRVVEGADNDLWVFKVFQENGDALTDSDAFCHLDSEYRILEGKLFGDVEKANKYVVSFLQEVYGKDRTIQKYRYFNQNDKERTLVFLNPANDPSRMEDYYQRIHLLWAVNLACIILGAMVAAYFIARKIRLSILPLNTLFTDYSNEKVINQNIAIPEELASVEENFILLTEKLEASVQHRIEMEQEKNRMIADLSHDLKSPLTVISGYAQALATNRIESTEASKYLDLILQKSRTAVEMINNLMQYATMEHPDYHMLREKLDFCEFLRVCLIGRYDEIEERQMDLELDVPEEEVIYAVDRRILGSVMENLINNTFRYNEAGTTIFLSLVAEEREIVVTYADTGVGIPEEIRKDVFKPFVIGNQARTSGKGTGIGMSIIRRGVEMHGGSIRLLDPDGTSLSTIFEMRFPVETEEV